MATISGSDSNNTLNGTSSDDIIRGRGGDDALAGFGGNDRLDGGTGSDTLRGGIGNDTYLVDSIFDVIDEEGNLDKDDLVQASISVNLATLYGGAIEHATLTGSAGLSATGNAADNVLIGNDGGNALDGADGNDSLNGGSGNDTITGGIGDDRLDGGNGTDVLRGGSGNDTYLVASASDVIDEQGNTDTGDTVRASVSVNLATLGGGAIENAVLLRTSNLNATGNASDNILSGNIGRNILDGAAGNDTLRGGAGNDTYVIDGESDVIDEEGNIDTGDLVRTSSVSINLTTMYGGAVEHATLTGGASLSASGNGAANVLTGNDGANVLDGADGHDTLSGGAGNDSLVGGLGNDSLDGGGGADVMQGGGGNDTYVVGNTGDAIDEQGHTDSNDTVQASVSVNIATLGGGAIENVILTTSSNLNATGNASDNILTGNSGRNTLDGGAGNDTISGGNGNDRLIGGTGEDTAIYKGIRTDYDITVAGDGTVTVKDLNTVNGNEGTDTATGVEVLKFSDGDLYFGHAPSAPTDADGAANAISDNASAGTLVGVTASSTDIDHLSNITYSLVGDGGGRFVVDPTTGVVGVASGAVFDTLNEPAIDITVRATDNTGKSADTGFTIAIQPTNHAPDADDGSNSGDEDTSITGQLTATDLDGDSLGYWLAAGGAPAHGQVIVNSDGSYSYAPNENYNGTDSFTFSVSDGKGETATGTIALTIAPVNDAPVAQAGSTLGNEDDVIAGQLIATDVDGA